MCRSKHLTFILILISVSVGLIAYLVSGYKASTLNIEAKTLEKGVGVVVAENSESKKYDLNFTIDDDEGTKKLYVIELPATKLKKVVIAPLTAAIGKFQIDRITLSNDAISYSWDELGACTQRTKNFGTVRRSPCVAPAPLMSTEADASVSLAGMPETGLNRSTAARAVVSLAASIGALLCMLWLTSACPDGSVWSREIIARTAWLSVVIVFVWHLYLICVYSVDVPYHDDWLYFAPDALTWDLPWRWIYGFFSEHRIVPTKLMAWFNLRLFGLDYGVQKIVNFLIFGGVIGAVALLKNRVAGKGNFQLFPLFLLFLLSPIAYENHRWGFQSQFHFVLIFLNLALCYAFQAKYKINDAALFCLFSIAAMYSFSAGVLFTAVTMMVMIVFVVTGIACGTMERSAAKRFFGVCIVMGIVVLIWHHGFIRPSDSWSQKYVLPHKAAFWDYFLNLLSYSFGFESVTIMPGIFCMALLGVPLVILLARRESRLLHSTWAVLAAIIGVLVVLGVISMSRTYLNFYGSKTSRYAEIGFLLIPYMAMAWWFALKPGKVRVAVLSLLWGACFISYLDDWSPQLYRETKQVDNYTLECVESYFNGSGTGVCQGRTEPRDLERAKELKANFVEQFMMGKK